MPGARGMAGEWQLNGHRVALLGDKNVSVLGRRNIVNMPNPTNLYTLKWFPVMYISPHFFFKVEFQELPPSNSYNTNLAWIGKMCFMET